MRCISNLKKKSRLLCLICIAALFISGCGNSNIENAYNPYSTDFLNGYNGVDYFSSNLCVTNDVNYGTDSTHSSVAEGAGVFNVDTKEVKYNQNIFERLYPASTTKVLTAYIILKKCNLSDIVTVSKEAANPAESSSVCGLKEGDQVPVKELLYGLLLKSGNDAAIALAEYCSGSVEAFADLMNQTAQKLGATQSHFVNPSGYPDENHYTTVYDMYLIFANAIALESFVTIINTAEHDAAYTDASGNPVNIKYNNTCGYLSGASENPEGINVVGGKTGTTHDAGYCLVLYSTNEKNERIISIVFKADGKSNLYLLMNEMLSGFAN